MPIAHHRALAPTLGPGVLCLHQPCRQGLRAAATMPDPEPQAARRRAAAPRAARRRSCRPGSPAPSARPVRPRVARAGAERKRAGAHRPAERCRWGAAPRAGSGWRGAGARRRETRWGLAVRGFKLSSGTKCPSQFLPQSTRLQCNFAQVAGAGDEMTPRAGLAGAWHARAGSIFNILVSGWGTSLARLRHSRPATRSPRSMRGIRGIRFVRLPYRYYDIKILSSVGGGVCPALKPRAIAAQRDCKRNRLHVFSRAQGHRRAATTQSPRGARKTTRTRGAWIALWGLLLAF